MGPEKWARSERSSECRAERPAGGAARPERRLLDPARPSGGVAKYCNPSVFDVVGSVHLNVGT